MVEYLLQKGELDQFNSYSHASIPLELLVEGISAAGVITDYLDMTQIELE